jgi:hypothetical protein
MNDMKRYDDASQVERVKSMLNTYGVSDERMRGHIANGLDCLVTRMDRALAAANARIQALTIALRSVKNVLDGVEDWGPGDVLANALCAYSTADDALAPSSPAAPRAREE